VKPIRCIRCKRPIKGGAVHRLGPECARILLVQLTAKKQPEPETDKRQVDWVGLYEGAAEVLEDAVMIDGHKMFGKRADGSPAQPGDLCGYDEDGNPVAIPPAQMQQQEQSA